MYIELSIIFTSGLKGLLHLFSGWALWQQQMDTISYVSHRAGCDLSAQNHPTPPPLPLPRSQHLTQVCTAHLLVIRLEVNPLYLGPINDLTVCELQCWKICLNYQVMDCKQWFGNDLKLKKMTSDLVQIFPLKRLILNVSKTSQPFTAQL